MRARKTCAIIVACGFAIGAALFVVEGSKRTAISLQRVTYRRLPGDRLIADFHVVNTGNTPIEFYAIRGARLRSEGPEGWIKDTVRGASSVEISVVLQPKERVAASIHLPKETGRWQIGYEVRPPTAVPAATATAPMVLTPRLQPIRSPKTIVSMHAWLGQYLGRWLEQRSPQSEEVWGQTFDAKAWLAKNPNAPIYMDIPFGAMFQRYEPSSF